MQRITHEQVPESTRYAQCGRGLVDAQTEWKKNNFNAEFAVEELFPLNFGMLAEGESMFADPSKGQLFLKRNGKIRLVAGRYGVNAHKDGPGPDARLAIGGLQGAYQIGRGPDGSYYFPQFKFGCISKASERADGTWGISTFYQGISSNGLAIDRSGNVYVSAFTSLYQLKPDGTRGRTFSLPISGVLQTECRGDKVIMITRQNAWDVVMMADATSGAVVRIAGMTQTEIDAWCAANGFNPATYGNSNHDGAAHNEAAFHSTGMRFIADDVSEIQFCGGDEPYVRRWLASTNRVDTLFVGGSWRETPIRAAAPHSNTDPNLPFWCFGCSGRQANGLPEYASPTMHVGEYWRSRWVSRLKLVEVPDQPPPPTGGTMGNDAKIPAVEVPGAVETLKKFRAKVSVINSGDTTWTKAAGYRLGAQNPHDNKNWGFHRVDFPDGVSVAPGQTYTFDFEATAPGVGSFNFQWRMLREAVAWFGALSTNVVIKVVAAAPPPPPDLPPTIDAVADPIVRMPDSIGLHVMATDPEGKPLTAQWAQLSGPPAIVADPLAFNTTAQPSAPGDYVFDCWVSDGVNTTRSAPLPVLVLPKIEPAPEPIVYKLKLPPTIKLEIPDGNGGTQEVIATVEIEPV